MNRTGPNRMNRDASATSPKAERRRPLSMPAILLLAFLGTTLITMNTSGQTITQLHREGGILDGVKIRHLDWHSPKLHTVAIDSAATLYLLKDDTLPIINLRLIFEGGTSSEELRPGIKSALAQALKLGGAAGRSGEEIADDLASLGATLEFGATDESFAVSLTAMKADFPASFKILEDILLKPDFRPGVLPVIQSAMKTNVQRRNDRPESISQRKLREIMFLPDRRGHSLNLSDIDSIDIASLRTAHQDLFAGRSLHIALDGDFEPGATEAMIADLVKAMPPVVKPYRVYERESPPVGLTGYRGKIVLVKKDVAQAVVSMGTFLPAHNDSDFYALQAGNYILGGGSFVSRLMQEVRAKRGLAYYSYSRNDFDARFGRFVTSSGTRADRTADTLRVMLEVIGGMDRIPSDELKLAVDSIINSLVFEYDNPSRILGSEIRFRIHHMPQNYLDLFQKKLGEVRPEDVRGVFGKHVRPEDFWIVVAGPASLQPELEKIRPVIVLDPEEVPAVR